MPAAMSRSEELPLTLLMARDAYQVVPNQPLGRQSAGASFLEAYLRFSGNQTHQLVVPQTAEAEWFHSQAKQITPASQTHAVKLNHWGDAATVNGAIHLPGPGLDSWAWKRMPWGDGQFSLLGIVHTLCSYNVQSALGQFSTAPVRSWDALICTSQASRNVVEGFLDRQEHWLRRRNEACRFERPQLPVIPLGIHPEVWAPPGGKPTACRKARQQLGLHDKAQIVLIAGRLDLLTKTQPAPLFRSLGELQQSTHPNLQLLVYGEAPNADMQQLWETAAQQLAPTLPVHWIPGREDHLAGPVRWAADVFVSLSDNPQETFGITPLEAMAAELPCLVSDWDGYRESVVQPGEIGAATGFRVTTRLVEGLGAAEAKGMLLEQLDYPRAVGQVAQGIAVDLDQFKAHLSTLLNQPLMRSEMGRAGRARVQQHYHWRTVINQWRDLLPELTQRREAAHRDSRTTPPQLPPWMPSTSQGYGCFASECLPASWSPREPDPSLELEHLNNPFQSWDRDGLLSGDDTARRRGWWLKQGLVNL